MTKVTPYRRDIRLLTSIRAVAASWVVFFHLTHMTGSTELTEFPIVRSGYLGVDFFFVLSGFVLTHVYQPQISAGRFDYWAFVVKRFARIYPMHLFTLLCFLVIGYGAARGWFRIESWLHGTSFKGVDFSVIYRAFVAHLTLIHAWGSTDGLMFNQPSWSISAEWFAYLMFPVFVLLRRLPPHNEGWKLVVVIALFLFLSIAFQVTLHGELTRLTWNLGILRIFPEFVVGMSLHRLGEKWSAGANGSVLGFAASVALVIAALVGGDFAPALAIPLATIAVIGLSGVVFFAADADRYDRMAPMAKPLPVYLGEISYSIYMIHVGVAIVLFDVLLPHWRPTAVLPALLTVCVALAIVMLISSLTYRLVEVPGREWIIRKARKLNNVEDRLAT